MDEPPQIHDGESIELYTLAGENAEIRNHSFVDCEIRGPAVLVSSQTVWASNRTTARVEDAVYHLHPNQRIVVGALYAYRCSFENCLFRGVGFVMHPDEVKVFKRDMKGAWSCFSLRLKVLPRQLSSRTA